MRKKSGFYLILLIGIGLITTMTVISSKKNVSNLDKDELGKAQDFVIIDEEEPSLEITRMEEEPNIDDYIANREIQETLKGSDEVEDEIEEIVEEEVQGEEVQEEEEEFDDDYDDSDDDPDYTFVDSNSYIELEAMIKPVEGPLGMSFTNENLIYSKTLEEWTSHKGIDILANKGTPVKATLSGTVNDVYQDEIWGIVIIIDHGNGLLTKYANLSTSSMINVGDKVNKGDVISQVGQTASIEMMEDAHLHFEIIKDGINQSPLDYLPTFSHDK